jgi:mono/diheme cytochrome c family protein
MRRWLAVWIVVAGVWGVAVAAWGSQGASKPSSGWRLPENAAEEKNPLTINETVLATGKKIFLAKCQRCHGPEAKGDGPDADEHHRDHMNLTNKANAADNPDGVVFYKIWNGRSSPRMPVFSEELTKEQAWAVVAYVQSLRGKSFFGSLPEVSPREALPLRMRRGAP